MQKQYIKTRCNRCMSYFEYNEEDVLDECPFCKTGEYLTDFTESDIKYLKDNNLY